MAEKYSIVCIYNNFFMRSTVNGHLGCFHVLAIVNSAAMNTEVVSFSILLSSGYMPRSRIAGSYGGFIPSFLRNLHAIFHSGCFQFTFLPTVHEGSFPSSAFIVCRHFYGNHSDWCKVIFHCSFDLHFSIMSDIEHLFMCLLAICMSSLEKCLFRSLSHFRIGLFFWYWVVWAACIIWKLILCQLFHLLLFSPILSVVFSPCL